MQSRTPKSRPVFSSPHTVAAIAAMSALTLPTTELRAQSPAWTKVATEGSTFDVAGTQTVRYGAGTSFVTKSVTGAATCSNAYFGSDPDKGTTKECDVASAAWTKVASEGSKFSVSGTQTVRFGAGSSFLTKAVTGSGTCSNAYFGGDPIKGTVKECDVEGSAVASAPPQVCTPPIAAVATATTAPSVGTGTAASCTEAALRSAIAANPIVTFNCGSAPTTIRITKTISVPTDHDTVIDGGNGVTLDGGNAVRILSLVNPNYRTNKHGLTLQHITLAHGKAVGTRYVAPSTSNPHCAYGWADGSGAAILVQDASLHVIDVTFQGNAAETPGPDVGGGAIYALGSVDVKVVGSTFDGNSGANAGAIGMLQSNFGVYNSAFTNNTASGVGENYYGGAANGCPGVGQDNQGGAGGNAGAIGIDGNADGDVVVCGSTFIGNKANELGGALFRTPDGAAQLYTIDRTLFQANTAGQGGAAYLQNSKPLNILASTFNNNVARSGGAIQLQSDKLNIVNTTFVGNEATKGLGGALFANSSDAASVIRNVTFTGNKSSGGSGYFSAAISGGQNFPITNTVFANNVTNDGGSPMQCWFSPGTGSNDVQWPRNHLSGGSPDALCVTGIAFADPLLGVLQGNGGPTPTTAPSAASPLRKAGTNCPATDQRGVARSAASCTVGAVE